MTRVVVGMSGGVDSSVAAALLQEQGYDVVGIMLRLWSEPASEDVDSGERGAENKGCSIETMTEARRVAALLGIPFHVVNGEEPFRATLCGDFCDDVSAGGRP